VITEIAIHTNEADRYFQKAMYNQRPPPGEMLLSNVPSTTGLTLEVAQHSHSSEKHIIVMH